MQQQKFESYESMFQNIYGSGVTNAAKLNSELMASSAGTNNTKDEKVDEKLLKVPEVKKKAIVIDSESNSSKQSKDGSLSPNSERSQP